MKRNAVTTPDLCPPLLTVVVIMSILFGLVQKVARHIDTARTASVRQVGQP